MKENGAKYWSIFFYPPFHQTKDRNANPVICR